MDGISWWRAQRGDQRAFEALALASHARSPRFAVGILRDPPPAEAKRPPRAITTPGFTV